MTPRRRPPSPDDERKVARPRSVGHRFACACAFKDDVSDLVVVGVRYDEDAPERGDSLVARLRAGRLEPLARADGIAHAIVVAHGTPHVLFQDGRLASLRTDGEAAVVDVVARGVLDIAAHGSGAVSLDDAGGVRAVVHSEGTTADAAVPIATVPGGLRLASDGTRVVVATATAVVSLDGVPPLSAGGQAVAVAGGRVAVGDPRGLLVGDARGTRRLAVAHGVHSLAFLGDALFVGSRARGLFVLDGDALRSVRPSLRARTLQTSGGGLVVASDLFVATSEDGVDFATRDLASIVRLLERSD